MRFFTGLNKLHTSLLIPFIFCSVILAVSEVLGLISDGAPENIGAVLSNFSVSIYGFCGYVFCYFLTFMLTSGKNSLKAFWSVVCLFMFNTALSFFYNGSSLFFTGVITALIVSFAFNRLDRVTALCLTLILSILLGILGGFIADYWGSFVASVADVFSGKGIISAALFGAGDTFLSLFDDDTLREMFFYKSYGGSILNDTEIVTGVKDMFSEGYRGELVSTYLSGHYFVIFLLTGVSLGLFFDLKKAQKYALVVTAACAVFSGNISILILFLFLESPFLFGSVIILCAVSYAAAYALKLSMGYLHGGGIIEMIIYSDRVVYLVAGGVVFIVTGYFVYKYIYEKHGISDLCNIYIPERLTSFVRALGGIKNIIRFRGGDLEVRNPKLIDTVSVDCDIKENIVSSSDDRMRELKEYLL